MFAEQEQTAKVFRALCDPKRVAVIAQLRTGEKCACELIETLGIAQSALSYHMKILCESGILESWNVGKWTHYRISEAGSAHAIALLQSLTTITPDAAPTCACAAEEI